jgi:DNA-binding response OmpR family regulator
MPAKILVVDDDPTMLQMVQGHLEAAGYSIKCASDGSVALKLTADWDPELVLMDVMMPVMDGLTTTRRIREFSSIPIIILTAKGDERDLVRGLDSGADDYVVILIDVDRARIVVRGDEISVTATEFRLLVTMAAAMGEVLTREELLSSVWGPDYRNEKTILWVTLSRLRQKIELNPKEPVHIITQQGIGYMMPQIDTEDDSADTD